MSTDHIRPVDVALDNVDIMHDFAMQVRRRKPGPPERVDGMTVGFVSMETSAPHGGEVHPDGDELLFIISGRVRVIGESDPDHPLEMGPGDACIVPRGEWHRVEVLEPVELVHMTPGPTGDHRPLPSAE